MGFEGCELNRYMRQFFQLVACLSALVLTGCDGGQNTRADIDENTSEAPVVVNESVITAGALSGLYVGAGKNSPVVLIIPGSGPTDLNGNNLLGVQANTYGLLAKALEVKGVSYKRLR